MNALVFVTWLAILVGRECMAILSGNFWTLWLNISQCSDIKRKYMPIALTIVELFSLTNAHISKSFVSLKLVLCKMSYRRLAFDSMWMSYFRDKELKFNLWEIISWKDGFCPVVLWIIFHSVSKNIGLKHISSVRQTHYFKVTSHI